MLKATNNAVVVEISKQELRNGVREIYFTGYFDRNTSATRSIPEIVAKILLCDKNIDVLDLENELSALQENKSLLRNWAAFLNDILKGTVQVSFETRKEPDSRALEFTRLGKTIKIGFFDDRDARIFFEPPTNSKDLITVKEEELLSTIRELLAEK